MMDVCTSLMTGSVRPCFPTGPALTAFVIPSPSSRHFSDLCMVCQCFRLHFVSSRTNSVATQLAAAALK